MLAFTAALVVYAFWGVDWPQLGRLLAGGSYWVLAPFMACLAVYHWLAALRWRWILRPLGRYTTGQVFPAMMIGFGGNNLLPARLGEILRAVVFARQQGLTKSGVLMTLVVERVLDVAAIFAFYLAAVATISPFPQDIQAGAHTVAVLMAGVLAGLVWFAGWPHQVEALWNALAAWLPAGPREKGGALVHAMAQGLSSLTSPGLLAPMLFHSVVRWGFSGVMVMLSLQAFGQPIGFGAAMIVIAVSALAVSLPGPPGFFGVMQATFVFSLLPFGVARETALASSMLFLLGQWAPTTAVGLYYYLHYHLTLADAQVDT